MLHYFAILLLPVALCAQPLSIEPNELDLGAVKIGTATRAEVRLENREDDELKIVIDISGDGFSAAPDTLRLAGNASGDIEVRFGRAAAGPHSGALTLRVKSFFKDESFTVPLQAVVARAALALTPVAGLDFGAVEVGRAITDVATLKNIGSVAAEFGHIAISDPSGFAIESGATDLPAPGDETQIQMIFTPERGGSFAAILVVSSLDFADLSIPLVGYGLAPRAAFSPLPAVGIDFATIELGQRPVRRVTILNQGEAELRIEAGEQAKITRIRLEKLADEPAQSDKGD